MVSPDCVQNIYAGKYNLPKPTYSAITFDMAMANFVQARQNLLLYDLIREKKR